MNYTNNIIIFITLFIIFFIINSILKKKYINENFLNNIDSESSDTIPKIIIQTWKTSLIPKKYIEDIKSLKRYNNDYKFMFFTDDDIDIFLKTNYPEYYVSYNKLPIKIQKIDYFRYIAIYHYGGFYFDLDIKCLYPLDELIHYDCVFPVDQNIIVQKCKRPRFKKYCDIGMKILLGQYAFGAKKHNEFIKLLIDTIHNNVDKYVKEHKKNRDMLQYVYSSTGPDFVTDVYLNYKNKNSIHILEYEHPQFFGKYAKHNHYGTWK